MLTICRKKTTFMRLNRTSIALIVVLALSISAYFIFIPNFETQEFNLDTIEDISEGITTTTPNASTISESTNNLNTNNSSEASGNEEIEIIVEEGTEEELLEFNKSERVDGLFNAYLLIGSDKRSEDSSLSRGFVEGQRADVIILGLIGIENDKSALISIPRDLLIKNSCTNKIERINASYNSNNCGNSAENLAANILNLTGIPVEHFASFSFEGFEKIIDSVGGIELCLEVSQREGYSFELRKGCQLVSGEISLNWIVSRNTEELVGVKKIDKDGNDSSEWKKMSGVSDLSRINRQQLVVVNLLNELKNFDSLGELTAFINALEDAFIIDEGLTNSQAANILWSIRGIESKNIQKLTIPTRSYETKQGAQVLISTKKFYDFLVENDLLD